MQGAAIIYGATQSAREKYVLELVENQTAQKLNWNYLQNIPDIHLVEPLEDKKSIGIAQTKPAIAFLYEKPLALDTKILIVNKAQLLTTEAQNALLKTLEEPPDYALILLMTKTENSLLPTIVSRCRKFKTPLLQEDSNIKPEWRFSTVLALQPGGRLDLAEELAKEEKDTIIELLESWVEEGRELLIEKPEVSLAFILDNITSVLEDLENTNVGNRIALEHLLLQFPE